MNVEQLMTKTVLTVAPETPLRQVAGLLVREHISGVPVVDEDGHVLGVVSEADILRRERGPTPGRADFLHWLGSDDHLERLSARTAGEAMSRPAVTIRPEQSVWEAAARLVDRTLKRLPVVDAEGFLVGIVTRADLVRAFAREDPAIAEDIRENVLVTPFGISPDVVEVGVHDGTVTLRGEVETEDVAELLVAHVRRVPGVLDVQDELGWQARQPHLAGAHWRTPPTA